jgi:phage terminase Nu1 subunit (DNA packaging protein)
MATQNDVAAYLGISEKHFGDLLRQGVFEKQGRGFYNFDECRAQYLKHLREIAHRKAQSGELNLTEERARLAREQADAKEMENAIARGELVHIEDVAKQFERGLERARTKLLAIPSKVAPEVHACATAKEVQAIIERNIVEALSELADRYEREAGEEA